MRLSAFSADIAHELRTPVTVLTTQAQVALSKNRSADEYREMLYSSLEEYERMGRMIGDMLFLAQADHLQSQSTFSSVDLATEARDLFDYFEALAEDRALQGRSKGIRAGPMCVLPWRTRAALARSGSVSARSTRFPTEISMSGLRNTTSSML